MTRLFLNPQALRHATRSAKIIRCWSVLHLFSLPWLVGGSEHVGTCWNMSSFSRNSWEFHFTPTDELIFFRGLGRLKPPTRLVIGWFSYDFPIFRWVVPWFKPLVFPTTIGIPPTRWHDSLRLGSLRIENPVVEADHRFPWWNRTIMIYSTILCIYIRILYIYIYISLCQLKYTLSPHNRWVRHHWKARSWLEISGRRLQLEARDAEGLNGWHQAAEGLCWSDVGTCHSHHHTRCGSKYH